LGLRLSHRAAGRAPAQPALGKGDQAGETGPAMTRPLRLHPDRLFPSDERTRGIARALHASVRDLPIVSPHGHTDPAWFATDAPFANPSELLIVPDHYVFRML